MVAEHELLKLVYIKNRKKFHAQYFLYNIVIMCRQHIFAFRIILCAEVTEEDFSVIHHEMGHIAYYMEYENQPAIFQVCNVFLIYPVVYRNKVTYYNRNHTILQSI